MSDERSASRSRLFGGRWRPRGLLLLGCSAVLLAAGGVAYATIPDSGTAVIHACYTNSTGALRVIDPSKGQSCAAGETALNWNGRGLNYRGSFSSTATYAIGDVVTQGGGTYVAKSASTNNPPPSSAWAVLSSPSYANVVSDSNESNPGVFPVLLSSNLTQVTQTGQLPAGNYTVSAQATVFVDNGAQDMQCLLEDSHGNVANGYAETSGPPDSASTGTVQTLSLVDAFTAEPLNTHIILKCAKANGADENASEVVSASLMATRVGRVTFNGTTVNAP